MKKVIIIILGVLLILTGAFLLFRPIGAFSVLGYVMGFALLASGIANIIMWFKLHKIADMSVWFLISAILSVICALCIFGDVFFKISFETVIIYIVAIWMIIMGITRIALSMQMKKISDAAKAEKKTWIAVLILGILLIICGIISLVNPIVLMLAIGINLSINMIFNGIDLITIGIAVEG